jgi:hypothetical protein
MMKKSKSKRGGCAHYKRVAQGMLHREAAGLLRCPKAFLEAIKEAQSLASHPRCDTNYIRGLLHDALVICTPLRGKVHALAGARRWRRHAHR